MQLNLQITILFNKTFAYFVYNELIKIYTMELYVIHDENSLVVCGFFFGGGVGFGLVCVPLLVQLYIESSHTVNSIQVKTY